MSMEPTCVYVGERLVTISQYHQIQRTFSFMVGLGLTSYHDYEYLVDLYLLSYSSGAWG